MHPPANEAKSLQLCRCKLIWGECTLTRMTCPFGRLFPTEGVALVFVTCPTLGMFLYLLGVPLMLKRKPPTLGGFSSARVHPTPGGTQRVLSASKPRRLSCRYSHRAPGWSERGSFGWAPSTLPQPLSASLTVFECDQTTSTFLLVVPYSTLTTAADPHRAPVRTLSANRIDRRACTVDDTHTLFEYRPASQALVFIQILKNNILPPFSFFPINLIPHFKPIFLWSCRF